MKKIGLFFIVLFLSGCSSSWYIKKAQEKCPSCFELDTTITELVIKQDTVINMDTLILVTLPRDTVKIVKMLPKYMNVAPVYRKNGIIHTKAWVDKGELNVMSWMDSTIWYEWRDSIRIKDAKIIHFKTITETQTITIAEKDKKLSVWKKIGIAGIIIASLIVGLLIAALIVKIIRMFKKK